MSLLLSPEERNCFLDKEPWTPYWSDCFKTEDDPYIECVNNKNSLLICYGDSWVWGDSLCQHAGFNYDNKSYREQHVFANHLAKKLDADFIVNAIRGIYNYWMIDRLKILIDHDIQRLSKQYKQIYIIVGLTELGRDFAFDNYIQDLNDFCTISKESLETENFLEKLEEFDFVNLAKIKSQLPENCNFFVTRNFTHTYPANLNKLDCLTPMSWTDVLFLKQGLDFERNMRMVSHGVHEFDNFVQKNDYDTIHYKKWFLDKILNTCQKQITLLNKSMYNHKIASKHPTTVGHELWADYLYNFIKSKSFSENDTDKKI